MQMTLHFSKLLVPHHQDLLSLGLTMANTACFAGLQVGQVILTLPNAFSTTGLAAGVFFQLIFATVALWTLFLMATLYQEFRRRKAAWRRDLHHGIIMVTPPTKGTGH